jgi:hypothetical protein
MEPSDQPQSPSRSDLLNNQTRRRGYRQCSDGGQAIRNANVLSILVTLAFCAIAVAQTEKISSHPDGDSPLARMTALAHTEALPRCDKIEILALTFPKPFADPLERDIPSEKAFPIRPYNKDARIEASTTITGASVESLAKTWRAMHFDKWGGAFCHEPVYGLRFYREDKLLFETSICWKCTNFYIPDVGERQPPEIVPETTDYQWYGFQKNAASVQLLNMLRKHLPHPDLD